MALDKGKSGNCDAVREGEKKQELNSQIKCWPHLESVTLNEQIFLL